jgi:hypothetical protein
MLFLDSRPATHNNNANMTQNMINTQLSAFCESVYAQGGIPAVRAMAKAIPQWCKDKQAEDKRLQLLRDAEDAAERRLESIGKAQQKPRKAVIRELRGSAQFKALKAKIVEAEKAARRAAADAKKLAAAQAKANAPNKQTKAWAKFFDKTTKQVEQRAKKVAQQLKTLVGLKKKAVARALKEAAAEAKKQAAEAKKQAAEAKKQTAEAKKQKPSKLDAAMTKAWNRVLTKSIRRGEAETKKALRQLTALKKAKKKADEKAAKQAQPKKTKKKAVEEAAAGDDLIAALLAKASLAETEQPKAAPKQYTAQEKKEVMEELFGEELEEDEIAEQDELQVVRFEHDGVQYLKDAEGYLYDPETQEDVGFWDGKAVLELEEQ